MNFAFRRVGKCQHISTYRDVGAIHTDAICPTGATFSKAHAKSFSDVIDVPKHYACIEGDYASQCAGHMYLMQPGNVLFPAYSKVMSSPILCDNGNAYDVHVLTVMQMVEAGHDVSEFCEQFHRKRLQSKRGLLRGKQISVKHKDAFRAVIAPHMMRDSNTVLVHELVA